ncbi:GH1 family beta-glucosidase [Terriglobus aquaticus]|uniref:GH1 family beta-glucosidase n=1 Tax=Terriglobus aquaticus TaxID=940139 RepID=UPI0021E067E8|nr:GH1 family beta-glucosidase [Terriglobus aquaticus]
MKQSLSRRSFAKLAAGAAAVPAVAASALSPVDAAAQGSPMRGSGSRPFPPDFVWGSATASYQVEGAVNEDGRGKTIWDTFSHTPGKVHNGDTGDVADDSYHRYPEDIALMKEYGLKGCRFSVAWSRIFPEGRGKPNQKGVDHYKKLVDALLAAGVQPFCTLYHWDLPQALQDKGGWQNKDTAQALADYAGYMAGQLSDRVPQFMTTNEIDTFVYVAYDQAVHAPGIKLSRGELAQVCHHAVLGHGLSVQAIRAHAKPGTRVGLAEDYHACTPLVDTPEGIAAARIAMREENASIMNAIMTGKYTDLYLKTLGADAPKFTDAEMKTINSPLDFVGMNCYTATYIRPAQDERGYAVVPMAKSHPHAVSTWLFVAPEALYWGPKLSSEVWGIKTMYITENGCSGADTVMPDGQIYDTDRVAYLRNYLQNLQRGISEGVPVKGYFLWSLLDNFEWAEGYGQRFGITYVDYQTQKRTPKQSALWYKALIARNAL